jgi:GNAT superfamily N-acetyltransferase
MNLHERPYRDTADLDSMRQLLIQGGRSGISASYMHPGMVDWHLHYPPDERENQRNIRLWERTGANPPALEAWAYYSRHEGTFDLFVSPALYGAEAHERVMAAYVAWAEARARAEGLDAISPFWVLAHDTVADRLLQAHGFAPIAADPPAPLFERALDNVPDTLPPPGFTVQGVRSREDGRLRAQITYSAFERREPWEQYWSEYAQFIGSAVYDGERDLFVRSPDGRGAAACTIWFDPVNEVGLFEPVATHAEFQRMGLGKAVMAEGLRRMRAAGMRRAILGFDPNNVAARALYTALGFRASAYFALYWKAVTPV